MGDPLFFFLRNVISALRVALCDRRKKIGRFATFFLLVFLHFVSIFFLRNVISHTLCATFFSSRISLREITKKKKRKENTRRKKKKAQKLH
jgi:hypothetical protein